MIRHIASLNPAQKDAVMQTEGPLLVLAGAGSGKTRVITTRCAHLIHRGVPAESIVAVTFTNKAAREMRERVSSLLKSRVKKQKVPLISTFHSLCLRILRKDIHHIGFRKDFTIYDTSEQLSLLRGLLSERGIKKQWKPEIILDRIGRIKNSLDSCCHAGEESDDLNTITGKVAPEYEKALRTLNAVDFDDLLLLTIELFQKHPDMLEAYRERFRYIMVDEYQDTNRVQYTLLKLLAGERKNLCVVGDDDQSVYSWRGANINNILDFERDFPGTKVIRLEQNYRSYGNILKAANSVIRNNNKRMEKSLWTSEGMGPRVKILKALNGEEEAQTVVNRLLRLKERKDLSYEDFAVIYRANSFSRPFEEALRRKKVPYAVLGGTSYFDRKEVKDLASYLKIILNERDDISLMRIANLPKRGIGNTTLGKLIDYAGREKLTLLESFRRALYVPGIVVQTANTASGFAHMIDMFRKDFSAGRDMGQTLDKLINDIDYRSHIRDMYKTEDAALKRIENVNSFACSLARYEESEKSPSLQGFIETLALDDQQPGEEKHRGVTLVSLHSSKGLEFPVVFIAGVEEDIIPHKKSVHETGGIEEERRLMYVGITRAMKELFLTHTQYRVKYGSKHTSSPSVFINEIPEEVVKHIDTASPSEPDVNEEDIDIKAEYARLMEKLCQS